MPTPVIVVRIHDGVLDAVGVSGIEAETSEVVVITTDSDFPDNEGTHVETPYAFHQLDPDTVNEVVAELPHLEEQLRGA